jgi:hypothetical protein
LASIGPPASNRRREPQGFRAYPAIL